MNREQHQKVTPRHLKRAALLYVRQSTMRQVFENTESTKRQYALRDRAVALGWSREEIVVVDGDLGHTATAAGDREGFEHVVTEVGMGRVGIVLGLEVSRLARNSSDWHRLLEICALADTLILDEDARASQGRASTRRSARCWSRWSRPSPWRWHSPSRTRSSHIWRKQAVSGRCRLSVHNTKPTSHVSGS